MRSFVHHLVTEHFSGKIIQSVKIYRFFVDQFSDFHIKNCSKELFPSHKLSHRMKTIVRSTDAGRFLSDPVSLSVSYFTISIRVMKTCSVLPALLQFSLRRRIFPSQPYCPVVCHLSNQPKAGVPSSAAHTCFDIRSVHARSAALHVHCNRETAYIVLPAQRGNE